MGLPKRSEGIRELFIDDQQIIVGPGVTKLEVYTHGGPSPLPRMKASLENQRIVERQCVEESESTIALVIQWLLIGTALLYFAHGVAEHFGYFRLRY